MLKGRRVGLILCITFLIIAGVTNVVYGAVDWYSGKKEGELFFNKELEIKKEIDNANEELEKVYNQLTETKNGVKIYKIDDVKLIDEEVHKILMLEECLRRVKERTTNDFLYVTYPLVSEIEQYGLRTGYTDSLYTDEFFDKKENEEYTDIRVNYDFFKDVSYDEFVQAIELIDFIDISNLQILFNPYKLFSSYAYCEDYVPEGLGLRRTRVYFIANEGEDIVSTFYHELGHMIYSELVKNNKDWYDRYYTIYKQEFDYHNGADNYGSWDKKLTENFAEDFKIYITNRIINNKEIDNRLLKNLVDKYGESFLGKTTVYEVKYPEINEYFNELLLEYSKKEIAANQLRPDIKLELEDYESTFKYKDSTYTNEYINKIVSSGNNGLLTFEGLESSVLNIKEIKTTQYSGEDYIKKIKVTKYKVHEGNQVVINLRGKDVLYEINIVLCDKDEKYSEILKYYIFK